MQHSSRSRRVRQRPRTRQIHRHQDQPMLWADDMRPAIRNRQVRLQVQERGEITPYGGLALAHDLAMRLGIDRDINDSMYPLKIKLPYFESDHVLTHAYNQYVGGSPVGADLGPRLPDSPFRDTKRFLFNHGLLPFSYDGNSDSFGADWLASAGGAAI